MLNNIQKYEPSQNEECTVLLELGASQPIDNKLLVGLCNLIARNIVFISGVKVLREQNCFIHI